MSSTSSATHDVLIRNLVVDESARDLGGYAFGVGESANVTIENSEAYRAGKHHFGAINTTNFVGRDLYSAWAMPDQGYGGASAYVSYSDLAFPNSRSEWFDFAYDELDGATAPYMVFYTHGPGMADLLVQDIRSNGGIGFVVTTDNPAERVRHPGRGDQQRRAHALRQQRPRRRPHDARPRGRDPHDRVE